MEKKLYIRPFTEVIKPFERLTLLSQQSKGRPIGDQYGTDFDAKDFNHEDEDPFGGSSMYDDLWSSVRWE